MFHPFAASPHVNPVWDSSGIKDSFTKAYDPYENYSTPAMRANVVRIERHMCATLLGLHCGILSAVAAIIVATAFHKVPVLVTKAIVLGVLPTGVAKPFMLLWSAVIFPSLSIPLASMVAVAALFAIYVLTGYSFKARCDDLRHCFW